MIQTLNLWIISGITISTHAVRFLHILATDTHRWSSRCGKWGYLQSIFLKHTYTTFTVDHNRCSMLNSFFVTSAYLTTNTVSQIRRPIMEVKVKVKCTLVQALRLCTGRTAHRGSKGVALLFLDHGTRRWWGVSVTPPPLFTPGTAVAQWLRCCATNWKVAGSIPAGVTGIFHWH